MKKKKTLEPKMVKEAETKELKEENQVFARVEREEEELKSMHSKLNRVIGQINGVKRMLDDGREWEDIFIQLSAITSVVNSIKLEFLKQLMTRKLVEKTDSEVSAFDELMETMKKYLKG